MYEYTVFKCIYVERNSAAQIENFEKDFLQPKVTLSQLLLKLLCTFLRNRIRQTGKTLVMNQRLICICYYNTKTRIKILMQFSLWVTLSTWYYNMDHWVLSSWICCVLVPISSSTLTVLCMTFESNQIIRVNFILSSRVKLTKTISVIPPLSQHSCSFRHIPTLFVSFLCQFQWY